jgi:hypothetical protein
MDLGEIWRVWTRCSWLRIGTNDWVIIIFSRRTLLYGVSYLMVMVSNDWNYHCDGGYDSWLIELMRAFSISCLCIRLCNSILYMDLNSTLMKYYSMIELLFSLNEPSWNTIFQVSLLALFLISLRYSQKYVLPSYNSSSLMHSNVCICDVDSSSYGLV